MKKYKILIVEDSKSFALGLEKQLLKLNYNVSAIASTAEAAIMETKKHLPDLVLMDIILKGDMNGIEAVM